MRISCAQLAWAMPLALAACGSESGPTAPHLPLSAVFNSGSGVEIRVSGAGVVNFSLAGVPNGKFQFVAHARADGSAWGHFYQSRETAAGLVEFSGEVICLTVDPAFPGRARIGGIVTENNSTNPLFLTVNHEVGAHVWFRVEDGGVGDPSLDKSTTYGFKPTLVDTSPQYCALPFDGLPWWNPNSIIPLLQGNIDVTY
ncbi:MAG TPA: hypothetical protein VJ717_09645 [Gemmatimonadaceae bacterium]|nr:hypothetical protein [Gemmatimonadaceae bacterium]